MEFKISYPKKKSEWSRYGLNKYYAGVHWAIRKKDADYWHLLTRSALKNPKMFDKPVIISFYFNDGLDISNHGSMAKMIEDALKGIVIRDDNRKCVVGHEYYFHDEDYILIKIREETL